MKKKFSALLFALLLVVTTLGGCMSIDIGLDTTKSKKKYELSMTVRYDKAAIDGMTAESISEMAGLDVDTSEAGMEGLSLDNIKSLPVVVVDGKEYYEQPTESVQESFTPEKKVKDGAIIRKDSFYIGNGSDMMDMGNGSQDEFSESVEGFIDTVSLTAKFDKRISKTNGKLSPNKKTVTFTYKFSDIEKSNNKSEMYAYTTASKSTLASDRKLMKDFEKKQKAKDKSKKNKK